MQSARRLFIGGRDVRGRYEQTLGWPYWLGLTQARRRTAAAALVLAAAVGAGAAVAAEGWRIDETQTVVSFSVNGPGNLPISGRFTRYAADIFIDPDRLERSFTRFTVDANSVDVGSSQLSDFIKSASLLNVAKFPTLSFASTAVERLDARTGRVVGDLTMLGVTRPVALTVDMEPESPPKGRAMTLKATGAIKRSDFGMTYAIPNAADAITIAVRTRALANE
jgi:polyisoprenoid-binding protein YceI